MSGTDALPTGPRTVLKFQTAEDMMQYATGCDSDVGGRSSVHLSLENDPGDAGVRANGGQAYARFWGDMRTSVRPGLEKRVRGGYAGFRNKVRGTFVCWSGGL
jgi:NADH dehydrogenase [ubiquinone] 1 alpha subcomplex assembly factor 1